MAQSFTETLEFISSQCLTFLSNAVILRRDIYDDYAVLRVEGEYQQYFIRIREVVFFGEARKYSYYIFDEIQQVIAGFDNAPDPKALQLKYGRDYGQHRLETIPHFHSYLKQTVELTDQMTVATFFDWLKQNL